MSRPTRGETAVLAVLLAVVLYVGGVAFLTPAGTLRSAMATAGAEPLTYDRMAEMISGGEVAKAFWNEGVFSFEDTEGETYVIDYPITFLMEDAFRQLREGGVEVVFGPPSGGDAAAPGPAGRVVATLSEIFQTLYLAFPVVVLLLVGWLAWRMLSPAAGGKGRWPQVIRQHDVRFDDVAGHGETRFELEEIKTFLKDPGAYAEIGARSPKGILMVGPPGTGKTLMAKALAGECGAAFIPTSGADFASMFVSEGSRKIRKVFEVAKRNAPAIVFIDEIDSIARRRGGDSSAVSQEKDQILNQLLVMIDGFEDSKGVIVVAATNRVDVLDPAILRAGRFDRQVHVGLPDRRGREQILALHARGKPLDPAVDLAAVAGGTPGFSGADLANLVNEAAIHAVRAGRKTVTPSDFSAARDKVTMGVERKSAMIEPDERRLIAFHEAGHALASCLVEHSDPVHQATIIPRGQSLGYVMRVPERDRLCIPKSKLLADLVVATAGRAAEEIELGGEHITTGAASDIAQATDIATRMVCEWGMSGLGMLRMARREDGSYGEAAEREIAAIVETARTTAVDLLSGNRAALERIAEALLERETLSGDEVRELAGVPAARGDRDDGARVSA
jgi:ATP-dependent metalloprotease FtsH